MLSLPAKQDGFRLLLPKNFLLPEIEKKYSLILQKKRSIFINPIDFLNETIQSIDVLGFNNAVIQQQQGVHGTTLGEINKERESRNKENEFLFPSINFSWRNPSSFLSLTDLTLNIVFRHVQGYLNYIMMYENFLLQYHRDISYQDLPDAFYVDLFDETGTIYCRLKLSYPLVNSMDMLSFSFTNPVAQNTTFKVEFKYSNFDVEFMDNKLDDEIIDNSF